MMGALHHCSFLIEQQVIDCTTNHKQTTGVGCVSDGADLCSVGGATNSIFHNKLQRNLQEWGCMSDAADLCWVGGATISDCTTS